MKTKHILTALALPTMFAACTADDIVSENNAMQQAERAKLSKDFVLNVNNGVESRYAVEGSTSLKFNFEEGDLIGANLIDDFDPTATGFDAKDPATWPIVNSVAPALPFEYKDGVWKSAGELGVGNYLFTNPYNPADKNRAAAKYELPVIVNYDAENPNAHIEAYNKAVAATVLREDDTEASINLKNIFAYPKFVINFDKNDEVTKVDKIILQKESGFIVKGALNHQDIVDMFKPQALEAFLKANKDKTEADYWAQFETIDFIVDDNDNEDYTGFAENVPSKTIIYEMNQKVVANSFEVRMILPSIADLTATETPESGDQIWMYIVTDKGGYKVDLTNHASYTFKETTLEAKIKKALTRNSSNTLKIEDPATATTQEMNSLAVKNIVSDVEDWNALVEKYGDLEKYSAAYNATTAGDKEVFEVNIINSDFALTSDLDMPSVAEFVIKSNVTVEGDVTLKNIKVDGGKLILSKGATLTTDQTLKADQIDVEEGAELIFAAAYNKKNELVAYEAVEKVCNHGTVTVPAGVEAKFELANAKDAVLNVGAAESRAAESAKAIANLAGANHGIINNYGIINIYDAFVNNAPKATTVVATGDEELAGYEYDNDTKEWDGVPTINNFATFNAKDEATNNGLFVNNGVLSSSFVGESLFNNLSVDGANYTATLQIAKNAETYIDSNASGKIVLSELKPAKFTIHNAKEASAYNNDYYGTIEYTLNDKSATTVDLSTSPVTHLTTNVGINLTKTYTYTDEEGDTQVKALSELTVNGGEVKIAATTKNADNEDVPVALVSKMIIKSGDVLVNGTINSVGEIVVYADATLGIPATATLSVEKLNKITLTEFVAAKEEKANGKLMINGILNLWNVTGDADGFYDETINGELSEDISLHKNAKITTKANTADSDPVKVLKYKDNLYSALEILVNAALENAIDVKTTATTWRSDWSQWDAADVEAVIEDNYKLGATWAKKAVADFLVAYNNLQTVEANKLTADYFKVTTWNDSRWSSDWQDIIGSDINDTYNGYKAGATNSTEAKASILKSIYTTATGSTALSSAISRVMGNTWIGTTVYVKEFDTQAVEDILSANGATKMVEDYKTAVVDAITDADYIAEMTNIEYLSWKKFVAATNNLDKADGTFTFAKEIVKSAYIDATSYIEKWEGTDSELYVDMKLWKYLTENYASLFDPATDGFVSYDESNLSVANMYAAFKAAYALAQSDDANVFFKGDTMVTGITLDKVNSTKDLKWTTYQMGVMFELETLDF